MSKSKYKILLIYISYKWLKKGVIAKGQYK